MKLFDSHCHINDDAFANDLDLVMGRAAAAGVRRIMIVGIDGPTSARAVALAHRFEGAVASVGVHPHDAKGCADAVLDLLKALAGQPEVRAWGEIGLDYNRLYSPQKDQEYWFVRQLEAARSLDLPLIFHERDSGGRFFDILAAHCRGGGVSGVVHCFSGTSHELDGYLGLGLHIGITGVLTMAERGRELRDMVCRVPADRLLLETDAPYLTPTPERNRTRRNEPAFVRSVLMKLARVRQEDPEALAETVWENTCRLFNLPEEETV